MKHKVTDKITGEIIICISWANATKQANEIKYAHKVKDNINCVIKKEGKNIYVYSRSL